MIPAHLRLLMPYFEGNVVQIKSPILLPLAIFHLPVILHIGAELSSPQRILYLHQDYAELLLQSAGIPMQTQRG